MSENIEVKSSVNGSYTVTFGSNVEDQVNIFLKNPNSFFLIDRNLADLFKSELALVFSNARFVILNASEQNKTIDYVQVLIRELIKQNIRKDDFLVVIGGGIVQDLAAFISSIIFRGIKWSFIPTTLLAQCDSCIGSKSSINFDQFKNLLGTFNPPASIYLYPAFLETLSESEIRSGIGEMLHYFLTEGIDIALQVSEKYEELLLKRSSLTYFIENSLRIKKKIIEVDEFDTSIRHIFNYGHTFGHAIEAISNYKIPHGQAVTIGMDIANFISLKRGILAEDDFQKMHGILKKNFPQFNLTDQNIDEYCAALSKDKKNKGAKLGAILSFGPGKLEKTFLDIDDTFKNVLLNYSSMYGC